jgi:hypothetical protein
MLLSRHVCDLGVRQTFSVAQRESVLAQRNQLSSLFVLSKDVQSTVALDAVKSAAQVLCFCF